jgi:hypothetical protein
MEVDQAALRIDRKIDDAIPERQWRTAIFVSMPPMAKDRPAN